MIFNIDNRLNLYFLRVRFFSVLSLGFLTAFTACSDINNGWSAKGGGYMNLTVNGETLKLEIEPDGGDVDLRYNKHYVTFRGSDGTSTLQFLVYQPELGSNRPQPNSSYTYFVYEGSTPMSILDTDSSYVRFDQKDSTLWSANIRLIFNHCVLDECDDTRTIVSGRVRYWVEPD